MCLLCVAMGCLYFVILSSGLVDLVPLIDFGLFCCCVGVGLFIGGCLLWFVLVASYFVLVIMLLNSL